MPIINRIADFHSDMTQWRQHIHANPELGFDCFATADFIVERLREFGIDEIHTGIATSGIVAIINGQGDGPTIGLRADIDALPIQEVIDHPYKSNSNGKMHACGHDGHTSILLGAARYLQETKNFRGRVALIFQPAEEDGGGGEVMCQEGMMERFDISQVYGLHNEPNSPKGAFKLNDHVMLAAVATFEIEIKGRGGHGANPEEAIDPIAAAANLYQAIQTISSRNLAGLDSAVISVTQINSGTASNIIPETAFVGGTVRTLDKDIQEKIEQRLNSICGGVAISFDLTVELDFIHGYPPTINHPKEAKFAAGVARDIAGETMVEDDIPPIMASEDFAYMLEERPGAYISLGQGDGAVLHHPEYDFNDEILPIGASYFAKLVETAQPR